MQYAIGRNTTHFHQHWTSIAGLSRKRLGSVPCRLHLWHRLEVLQHLGGVLEKRRLSAKERHSSVWNSLKSEFHWSGLEATAEPNPIPPSLLVRSSEDQLLFCKGLSFQAFAFKLTNNSIRGGRIFTQLSEVSPHFHFPALRCFAFPACAHGSSTLMRSPLPKYSPPSSTDLATAQKSASVAINSWDAVVSFQNKQVASLASG